MATPRIEIDLGKIAYNAKTLKAHYASKGIDVIGVTKSVCGNLNIAKVLLKSGIKMLADSRISNIERLKRSGILSPILLLRTPLESELNEVITHCDFSHNTEYSIIEKLSQIAENRECVHKIILMVELGDLREGILPSNLAPLVLKVKKLKGIEIVGIGCNLACFGGVQPDDRNMGLLSTLAIKLETQLGYKLSYVSGGNSANYQWANTTNDVQRINCIRLGESIFLGCDPLTRMPIAGMFTNAFTLVAEVIESGVKPSVPIGKQNQNAFGDQPHFENKGLINRVILGIGLQDVAVSGLRPRFDLDLIGASSDHLILDAKYRNFKVGTELPFDVNYSALLSAMTSPYVTKNYVNNMTTIEYCKSVQRSEHDLKLLWPTKTIVENNSELISLKGAGFNLIYEPSIKTIVR